MTDYEAVLWDLDGTIVDTEPLWIAAEHEIAAEHGKTWTTEDALKLVGNSLIVSGEYIRDRLEIDRTPEQIVDFLISRVVTGLQGDIPWRPGAVKLIRELDELGIPQALVTMSWVPIAEPVVALLPFAAVVTGDAVSRPKPHPDPYLLAAERLGVDPARCLAIEDSATGAASASAAGCDVVVVPHMVAVPQHHRRRELATLHGVDAPALLSVFT